MMEEAREMVRLDRVRRLRVAELVGASVRHAQRSQGLSVAQVAAFMSGGVGDPGDVSRDTLYKAQEGERGLWMHKVVALGEATGDWGVLGYLAEAAGFFLVPRAVGEDLTLVGLRGLMRESAEAVEAVCGAIDRGGEDGEGITVREFERVGVELDQLVVAAVALKEECRLRMEMGKQGTMDKGQGTMKGSGLTTKGTKGH